MKIIEYDITKFPKNEPFVIFWEMDKGIFSNSVIYTDNWLFYLDDDGENSHNLADESWYDCCDGNRKIMMGIK